MNAKYTKRALSGEAMRTLMSEFVGYEVTQEVVKEAGLLCGKRWADEGDEKFEGSIESVLGQGQDGSWWGAAVMDNVDVFYWERQDLKIDSILDHGCGIGASTLALQEKLPHVRVVGSNLAGAQLEFARFLAKKFESSATFVDEAELGTSGHFDGVTAFELLEHFRKPMDEVDELLRTLTFNVLFEASSFGKPKIPGHFASYNIDGVEASGRQASTRFTKAMMARGFTMYKPRFFNGRPRVFYRGG